jgi:predicted ester cyclase
MRELDDAKVANIALVDRFFNDVLNGENPAAVQDLLTADCLVHHCLILGGEGHLPEVMELMARFQAGFGNLHYVINDHVADGDKVAVRWTATGVHTGTFYNIGPTGMPVVINGNDIARIVDGRIAEVWVCSDLVALLQQLGAFPPAARG